jgi:1-acyl-sn-glycerol-3-phosphate acyltransferase
LLAFARGSIALILIVLNTLVWSALLLTFSVVKLVLPIRKVRQRVDPLLNGIATAWIACNGAILHLTSRRRWDVEGNDQLQRDGWYLVLCNHQSWADILVLQQVLSRRVPMLKFFLKQQLIYVPVIGLAWWALDFPFLRRHGKTALARHPELRLQDRDATRLACERFRLVPTSVMSFPEGTRFTTTKQAAQSAPYRHLLRPKAGALAMSLEAMGDRFRSVLDVTIVYPGGAPTFWQFLCGQGDRVVVRISQLPIPADFCSGDYAADNAFRQRFHRWLEALWRAKDSQIEALLQTPAAAQAGASADSRLTACTKRRSVGEQASGGR